MEYGQAYLVRKAQGHRRTPTLFLIARCQKDELRVLFRFLTGE